MKNRVLLTFLSILQCLITPVHIFAGTTATVTDNFTADQIATMGSTEINARRTTAADVATRALNKQPIITNDTANLDVLAPDLVTARNAADAAQKDAKHSEDELFDNTMGLSFGIGGTALAAGAAWAGANYLSNRPTRRNVARNLDHAEKIAKEMVANSIKNPKDDRLRQKAESATRAFRLREANVRENTYDQYREAISAASEDERKRLIKAHERIVANDIEHEALASTKATAKMQAAQRKASSAKPSKKVPKGAHS